MAYYMENEIPFEVMILRQVIKDIEDKKANSFSIQKLNTLQHILLFKKINPLVVGDIYRDERFKYSVKDNTCCRRMRYWWF